MKMPAKFVLIFNLPALMLVGFLIGGNAQAISAGKISADIKIKQSFKPGEKIIFSYEITSPIAQSVAFSPQIECNHDIPQPIPNIIEAELLGQKFIGEYSGPVISESAPPAECRAVIQTIRPSAEKFSEKFTVAGNAAVAMRFLVCEDSACGSELRDFALDTPFYLDYRSTQKFPVQALVRDEANNLLKTLDLPDWYSFNEPGTYSIEFSFRQPGFQPMAYVKTALIAGQKKSITPCDNNGKCEPPENARTCPDDCGPLALLKRFFWILPICAGVIILMFIAIYYLVRSNKNKPMAG